jgi:hypothetical protein
MPTMLDHQVGWKVESTYGTAVTVDRFAEFLPGSSIDWDPNVVQGKGLRVGARTARSARRVPLIGKGSGKLQLELTSKGLGTLFQSAFGIGASTLVSAGLYQQNFNTEVTGSYLPSFTLQEGVVKPGGTVDTYTAAGCTFSKFEIEMPGDGIATFSGDFDFLTLATNVALATASYPTSPTLYASGMPVTGAMQVGGTLTAPTTTALASLASSTNAVVKSWKLSVDHSIDTKRDRLGGRSQPTAGECKISLSATVEYDATTGATFRDAQIGQTAMPILLNATTAEVIGSGNAALQIVLPAAFVGKGAIPVPSAGEVITTDIEFDVLDNLTNDPLALCLRTADAAL